LVAKRGYNKIPKDYDIVRINTMSLQDNTTRSLQIVAGSTTTAFSSPNTFTYTLPSFGFKSGKDEVAMKSLTVYYSWPNISAAQGNNSLQYTWPVSNTTHQVVLADGIWSFTQIMQYLEQVMQINGHYLLDDTGAQVYYMNFVVNPVLYCLSLTVTPLPTVLPTGWYNPANVNLTAAAGKTPQLIIPNSGMASLTGFPMTSYPTSPQTSLFQLNSFVPQISSVTSLNIVSNLVDNGGFSLTPNILASFVVPSDQTPGSLIQLQPSNLDWIPVQKDLTFNQITVSIVDQLMRPITVRDPQGFVMILNLRKRN
jgi:hypothetical protein